MNPFSKILQIIILVLIATTSVFSSCGEKEEKIALSEVPEVVLKAAQNAVKGIEIKEAEIEKTSDGMIYDLEGIVDGKTYEIEITPDGKIIEVEQEDDDDGVENEDDEDDEDEEDEEHNENDDHDNDKED
jgi:hypothetical protein